jgi:hypothetical protein
MAGDDRESEKPFKVQDRRRFSSTGEARPESEVERETPPSRRGTRATARRGTGAAGRRRAPSPHRR